MPSGSSRSSTGGTHDGVTHTHHVEAQRACEHAQSKRPRIPPQNATPAATTNKMGRKGANAPIACT